MGDRARVPVWRVFEDAKRPFFFLWQDDNVPIKAVR
jgi:hypothetical protein